MFTSSGRNENATQSSSAVQKNTGTFENWDTREVFHWREDSDKLVSHSEMDVDVSALGNFARSDDQSRFGT